MDIGIAVATGTAPPVEDTGAAGAAAADTPEPWSTAAESTAPAAMVGAIAGATGAWGGAVAGDPVAFISPCDRFWAPAAAGWPVIIPWANDCPS
ncbi:hypothetical protein A5655_24485 [Mycobacterium sp. 1081908.1]|nr:hypothetical protein A5655_24485 [Mycobacterium sp. 1081908.1]